MTTVVPTSTASAEWDVLATLQPWRDAGVLTASDVFTAATLARLGRLGPADAPVALAVALAARAPRHGHVCLDLSTVRVSVPAEIEGESGPDAVDALDALAWPTDLDAWRDAIAASTLVVDQPAPLVLDGTLLYLERYRVYESQVAAEVLRRAGLDSLAPAVDDTRRRQLLEALLGPEPDAAGQWAAAAAGAVRPLSVIVGGPGTGKTRTVATLLALLASGSDPTHVALVAPTGKAAARLGETFRQMAQVLRESGVPDADVLAGRMEHAEASTIHRLLGALPGSGRFRHDRTNPLTHDLVVVDETSMVSLPLMAKLLDAVRPDAQVVLVGDPGQLASVEAGSVLGDIAAPAVAAVEAGSAPPPGPLTAAVSVLTASYRFPSASPVGRFAAAVRAGDADTAVGVLTPGATPPSADASGVTVSWHPEGADTAAGLAAVRTAALAAARATVVAARAGDAAGALAALARVRVLCAHRRGPFGVARWNWQFERWLDDEAPIPAGFYVGRPVFVTANDPVNRLFNGDLGVVVDVDGRIRVAFPERQGVRLVAPARLEAVETVHAMTIHKSQGSEFGEVVVVLPPPDSRLATRELLYTAVTRASRAVTIVGSEASLRAAIERRVVRASGLGDRLWSPRP